jgi:uncharacterized coiled-coil protein SlyX
MIDASFSRHRDQEDRAAAGIRHRWIFAAALGIILSGLGGALLQRGLGGNGGATPTSATTTGEQTELLETTKGLQITQQQAVDQLQVVQDQLVAQKAETKKLSEQIATMTEKLEALHSAVSAPASTPAAKSR